MKVVGILAVLVGVCIVSALSLHEKADKNRHIVVVREIRVANSTPIEVQQLQADMLIARA